MSFLISILTPTYNRSEFFEETIDSAINQTYPHWEMIVVDDGSSEEHLKVIERQCKRDQRITFIQRNTEKKGAPVCRNIAIDNANGDFCLFLDSDDIIAPYFFQTILDIIKKEPRRELLIFPAVTFDNKSYLTGNLFLKKEKLNKQYLYKFLEHDLQWFGGGAIWKSSALKKIGKEKESLPRFQDIERHIRALHHDLNVKLYHELKPMIFIRIHRAGNLNSDFLLYAGCYFIETIYPMLITKTRTKSFKKGILYILMRYSSNLDSKNIPIFLKKVKKYKLISFKNLFIINLLLVYKKLKLDKNRYLGYNQLFHYLYKKTIIEDKPLYIYPPIHISYFLDKKEH